MSRFLSMRKGEVRDVDNDLAEKLIADGVADEYKLVEPTGKITITENDTDIDVAQYAKADVNVATVANNCSLRIHQTGQANVVVPQSNGETISMNSLIDLIEPVPTLIGVYGNIYPTNKSGEKITVTDAENVKYAEVGLTDGEVGTSTGIVFFCFDEIASITFEVTNL